MVVNQDGPMGQFVRLELVAMLVQMLQRIGTVKPLMLVEPSQNGPMEQSAHWDHLAICAPIPLLIGIVRLLMLVVVNHVGVQGRIAF